MVGAIPAHFEWVLASGKSPTSDVAFRKYRKLWDSLGGVKDGLRIQKAIDHALLRLCGAGRLKHPPAASKRVAVSAFSGSGLCHQAFTDVGPTRCKKRKQGRKQGQGEGTWSGKRMVLTCTSIVSQACALVNSKSDVATEPRCSRTGRHLDRMLFMLAHRTATLDSGLSCMTRGQQHVYGWWRRSSSAKMLGHQKDCMECLAEHCLLSLYGENSTLCLLSLSDGCVNDFRLRCVCTRAPPCTGYNARGGADGAGSLHHPCTPCTSCTAPAPCAPPQALYPALSAPHTSDFRVVPSSVLLARVFASLDGLLPDLQRVQIFGADLQNPQLQCLLPLMQAS